MHVLGTDQNDVGRFVLNHWLYTKPYYTECWTICHNDTSRVSMG